ncbi:MAG TPA: glycosyltransferase family 87 protein [Terracidiphilus sp.]|jgi:hypothetical protein
MLPENSPAKSGRNAANQPAGTTGGGTRQSPLRKLAAAGIVLAGIAYVLTLFVMGLSDRNAAERDFISYWAAGKLAVSRGNPYDPAAVRGLETGAGREANAPVLVMRNPPVALPLVAPLGFLSAKNGLVVWLAALIGCVGASIWMIWRMQGRPQSSWHLVAIGFAPTLACLMAGQFGIFLLLGVVLFLYFGESRPALAGAALLLCALKPHLFVPVAIPLVLWIVIGRRVRLASGFAGALIAALGMAWLIDPQAIAQYVGFMRSGEATAERIPALSVALRFAISPPSTWIQFVPLALACVWAAWYFWTRREGWNWRDHGLLVLLVAAVCTPYGFLTDESMLLPAVLAGVYGAEARGRSLIPIAGIAAAALVELLAGVEIKTFYFLWTTPAWLGWYLYATRGGREKEGRSIAAPAG